MKVTPNPATLKHFKDGEFHKDYDRQMTVSSFVNFLRDPSGDLPWEEDNSGTNVVHLNDSEVRMRMKDVCIYQRIVHANEPVDDNEFLIRTPYETFCSFFIANLILLLQTI